MAGLLQGAGGALHSKRELYQAAGQMVGSLGDSYSEFMPPSQFRRALRRPLPAERNYLAAQYVGKSLTLEGLFWWVTNWEAAWCY